MRFKVTILLLGAVVMGGATLIFARAAQRPDQREVVLVARDMALYLAGDPATANPTIRFKKGEEIRLVFRNIDTGITHGVAIPDMQVRTALIAGGSETTASFRVPERAGAYEYVCAPHAAMMHGTIIVEP
jgi:plastocyanin